MPEGSGTAPTPVGLTSEAPSTTVAQHFTNSLLGKIHVQQQRSQQQQQQQQRQRRAASGSGASSNSSKLPTLPEASHVNALNEATGPSPLGIPGQVDASYDGALADLSTPQRAVQQARSVGYGFAIMELANDEFRQRWETLCLTSPEDDVNDETYQSAPGPSKPSVWNGAHNGLGHTAGGMGGSWELLAASAAVPREAGGRSSMPRSSSRSSVTAAQNTTGFTAQAQAQQRQRSKVQRRMAQMREAEEWRQNPTFRRTELNLTRLDDSEGVIALAPAWLELDSPDEGIRLDSEIALHALLSYASYLSVAAFILPPPSSDPSRRHLLPHYARAISAALSAGPGGEGSASAGSWMNLTVRLPISSPHSLAQVLASKSLASLQSHNSMPLSTGSSSLRASDDWAFEAWSQIRHLCGYHSRLHVLLDLSMPLPSSSGLSRWVSEPVSHMWLPASTFLANAKGFPVLSKATQSFLRLLLAKASKPAVVLAGTHDPPPQHTRGGPTAYLEYLRHLEKTSPPEDAVAVFARGYADYLQAPLQPLMDNLEGATYEVFERDPVKYALYQEAVRQALLTRSASEMTVIWVCGAGRGPLVSRCLTAAEEAGRAVKIVALEKNPSAMITLQEKQVKEWGADRVELRFGDMRTAERPARESDRADILVSELLGSFGDNELSPECLDGACRFLKRTGVSIPASYTSFLTPLTSSKLHSEVLASGAGTASGTHSTNNPSAANAAQLKSAETPFVVLFGAVDLPATPGHSKIQECWSFAHGPMDASDLPLDSTGLPISNSHNVRTTSHTFTIPQASLVHGLAGYFEAHLFGDVTVSIHPDPTRGSKDMLSWFPIFFPLKEPLYVPSDGELDVHMWRLTKAKKVWYEWSCEVFLNLPQAAANASADPSNKRASALTFVEPGRESPMLGLNLDAGIFANAPQTPRVPSVAFPDGHGGGQTQRQVSSSGASNGGRSSIMSAGPTKAHRIKIGMSSLQNPSGRSSWVGM